METGHPSTRVLKPGLTDTVTGEYIGENLKKEICGTEFGNKESSWSRKVIGANEYAYRPIYGYLFPDYIITHVGRHKIKKLETKLRSHNQRRPTCKQTCKILCDDAMKLRMHQVHNCSVTYETIYTVSQMKWECKLS